MAEPKARVDCVSIPYLLPNSENESGEDNRYQAWFAEDVAKGLFPISGTVRQNPVFQLLPKNEHFSETIQIAFAPFDWNAGSRRTISSVLSGFGNRTAYRLLIGGSATVEVAPILDENAYTNRFMVRPVDGVKSFAGLMRQWIPWNPQPNLAELEIPKPTAQRPIRIPSERIVRILLPRKYQRIPQELKALRHFRKIVPDFALDNFNPDGSFKVPVDFAELSATKHRAVASTTQSTGWDGRGIFRNEVTGHYMMRRFLRFEEFRIRLREAVLSAINRILAIMGEKTEFCGEVTIHHLPTLNKVEASRRDLAEGKLGYSKMVKLYSY